MLQKENKKKTTLNNLLLKRNVFLQKPWKNKAGRVVPDLFFVFCFLKKVLYEVKAGGQQLSFNIFW